MRVSLSLSPVPNSIRVAAAGSTAMANGRTAVTSLLALPLLEVLLLVVVATSVGNTDTTLTAYLGTLLALGLAVLGGTAGLITRDRLVGLLVETLLTRPFAPVFWLGKVVVPVVTSSAVGLAAVAAIFAIDPEHDIDRLLHVLVVMPLVVFVGVLSGVAVALASLLFRDPYAASNIVGAVLPITAGIVAPLSLYPAALEVISRFMPFSASIELSRSLVAAPFNPAVLALAASDLLVAAVWLAIGVGVAAFGIRRVRDGRDISSAW